MIQQAQHRFEGEIPAGSRFAIIVSRFNESITSKLLDGAIETLRENGVSDDRFDVTHVPGAFEIPLIADRLAKSEQYAAVICLGAVIQGETDHHEYINQQVAAGLMRAGMESGVPVIFGILTCKNMDQAVARSGGAVGNKGSESAVAAIEMVSLLQNLPE